MYEIKKNIHNFNSIFLCSFYLGTKHRKKNLNNFF